MNIQSLTLFGGVGKNGQSEAVKEINLKMGQVISIVGPTGSGKTTLIDDIALFANDNTPSRRRVLINGAPAPEEFLNDPSQNPVAFITQHTNFLSDLPVRNFLEVHAGIRGAEDTDAVVRQTLEFANQLTGEPIILDSGMTDLSGGQTRALLIADAVIIGNSPIILLDEIENAGIHRTKALDLLRQYQKIFIFVTHDPRIALLSEFRVVMKNGGMQQVLATDTEEQHVVQEIKKLDDLLLEFRRRIRDGFRVGREHLEEQLQAIGYI